MTIAAAFTLDDGVLFVADTQHTWQAMLKLESSKIFPVEYPSGGKSIFALAGDVDLCKMFIQHCEAKLGVLDGSVFSREGARQAVELVFAKDFRRYGELMRMNVSILAAIYCPKDHDVILLANGPGSPSIVQLFGYSVIGSGMPLGHYLVRDAYGDLINRRIEKGPFFAKVIHAFKVVKEYVDGCGQTTHVAFISKTRFDPPYSISDDQAEDPQVLDHVYEGLFGAS
jgi:hypothetical protein